MLTARTGVDDQLMGYEAKVDDYMYGVKLNDPTDTNQHWYATDAAGTVTEQLLNDDIQLDMNNLWVNGFVEAANPATAIAPSFYGMER